MHYIFEVLRILMILMISMMMLLGLSAWDNFFSPEYLNESTEHFLQ